MNNFICYLKKKNHMLMQFKRCIDAMVDRWSSFIRKLNAFYLTPKKKQMLFISEIDAILKNQMEALMRVV